MIAEMARGAIKPYLCGRRYIFELKKGRIIITTGSIAHRKVLRSTCLLNI